MKPSYLRLTCTTLLCTLLSSCGTKPPQPDSAAQPQRISIFPPSTPRDATPVPRMMIIYGLGMEVLITPSTLTPRIAEIRDRVTGCR